MGAAALALNAIEASMVAFGCYSSPDHFHIYYFFAPLRFASEDQNMGTTLESS
jgi:hypothetical protein